MGSEIDPRQLLETLRAAGGYDEEEEYGTDEEVDWEEEGEEEDGQIDESKFLQSFSAVLVILFAAGLVHGGLSG